MHISNSQKNGIIQLAVLMVLLFVYMYVRQQKSVGNFSLQLNEEEQCWVDNQKALLAEKEVNKKQYQYYVNYLDDYKGYIVGMSVDEIDRYLAYKDSGKSIHTEKDFLRITKMSGAKFDTVKKRLKFSSKIFKKDKKAKKPKLNLNLNTLAVNDLIDMGISKRIAFRIINYRKHLGRYTSLEELDKVYDITKKELQLLKSSVYLKK